MLVVLEGPEKAGKTTLGMKLFDSFQGKKSYIHHVAGDSTIKNVDAELDMIGNKAIEHLTVVDRWWLSELVYGPLMGRESTLKLCSGEAHYRWGKKAAHLGRSFVVWAPEATLTKRREPDDLPVTPAQELHQYYVVTDQVCWLLLEQPSIETIIDNLNTWAQEVHGWPAAKLPSMFKTAE